MVYMSRSRQHSLLLSCLVHDLNSVAVKIQAHHDSVEDMSVQASTCLGKEAACRTGNITGQEEGDGLPTAVHTVRNMFVVAGPHPYEMALHVQSLCRGCSPT